jgi:3-hydroxybutyrate dehydrogenase
MATSHPKQARKLVVLITGAGSGLGRDLAIHFGSRRHRILVTDVKAEAAEETCRLLGKGADAAAWPLDVRVDEQIEAIAGSEAIDVVINNAGLQFVAPLEEFPAERWSELIDVLLKGPAAIIRAALPGMRSRGFGRIINIGSIHSLVASPYKSAYVAAKHGLIGLTRTLALETADQDITVNAICPSYIRTPLVEAQIAAQADAHKISREKVVEQIMLAPMPKKCFITAEEIAGTIDFLIGAAARNITGQMLVIDGGWTVR